MASDSHQSQLADELSSLSVRDEDSKLITDLIKLSSKSGKLVKSNVYDAPADPSIKITSWKMNEFKYYDVPSPFPTLARGLFTQQINQRGDIKHRIVARGYDKFFNIGEVPWTTWASLEANTSPPYTLSLKSNGCIIFIAALTPSRLLVTSKHSLGPIGNANESHAQVGERWLRQHLADAGKSEAELAAVLWSKNWTAVAELCDDSFEEHVLPYSREKTGLHLHGINECTKEFRTMLPDVVDAFAREWGFIVTPSTQLHTIPEVKSFTEEIGRTGKWNGEALEGFVVRTHISLSPASTSSAAKSLTPYTPGSSFFFKVKFDEPYMMYRDWREVTKVLLSKGPSISNVPKSKMRRPETQVYVKWVIDEIKRDRTPFAEYNKGKGIIATRERFQRWLAGEEGRQALTSTPTLENGEKSKKTFGKTIIVPVAIPGVGKTSLAVALAHLFGFGHTQSDDVRAKKPAPIFIKNVVDLLKTYDVVIADKNNHLIQHRKALREATAHFSPPVRLLALHWPISHLPPATIHRICGDRVLLRGENHQSLRADAAKSHEEVIWTFLHTTEELMDSEVDEVVEMSVEEGLEESLSRAVEGLMNVLDLPRPEEEKMGEALGLAKAYRAGIAGGKHGKGTEEGKNRKNGKQEKQKKKDVKYYGLLAELELEDVLGRAGVLPEAGRKFWEGLVQNKRVTARPHVTLVHSKSVEGPEEVRLWERSAEMSAMSVPPMFRFRLSNVVWDGRVMAAVVEDLGADQGGVNEELDLGQEAEEFVRALPERIRQRLHITVGTENGSIPAVEGGLLVERWRAGEEGIKQCKLEDVWVKGRLKGLQY